MYPQAMFLTDEDVNKFIRIYKKEFGENIPFAEARRRATEIMELFVMLLDNGPGDE